MTEQTTPPNSIDSPAPDLDDEQPSDEFARALESFAPKSADAASRAKEVSVGDRASGKVVSIGDEHVLLDIGGRSEAVAETKLFRSDDGALSIAIGDAVELYVVAAGDEIVLAPTMRTEPSGALVQMREAMTSGVPVSGRVIELNSGGLSVEMSGVRGFCPLSQIEAGFCADASVYVGRTVEFLVTEVKGGRGGVVLSRKRLLQRAQEDATRQLLASLKVGDEHDATVTGLEAFGAFVDIGGVQGMVHVSEIGYSRVGHPRDLLRNGERVRVRVLKIDPGKGGRPRIALSIKAAQPDPWIGIENRFAARARVHGTVVRLTDFGAFVNLEPGIDGLVHVSEAAGQRVTHVKDVFTVGQQVEAIVLAVDPVKKRISLSVRAAAGDFVAAPPAPSAARKRAEARDPRASAGKRPEPRKPAPAAPPARVEDTPPTTMAIALRQAVERAKAKKEVAAP